MSSPGIMGVDVLNHDHDSSPGDQSLAPIYPKGVVLAAGNVTSLPHRTGGPACSVSSSILRTLLEVPPPLPRYAGDGGPLRGLSDRHPCKTHPAIVHSQPIGCANKRTEVALRSSRGGCSHQSKQSCLLVVDNIYTHHCKLGCGCTFPFLPQSERPPSPLLRRPSLLRRIYRVVGSVLGRRFCFARSLACRCSLKEAETNSLGAVARGTTRRGKARKRTQ